MREYYQITELRSNVYRIYSAEQVFMELFVGTEKALLLDTGYALGDLKAVVKKITTLPLYIVNTHGHLDHTCGNCQFDEAVYIHPKDMMICRLHNSTEFRTIGVENGRHSIDYKTGSEINILPEEFDEEAYIHSGCGQLIPVEEGYVFDLGGITLDVIELPGHTAGGIGLLYREEKILYAGDSMNQSLWLFAPDALKLADYRKTLEKAKTLDFSKLVMSHNHVIADKSILDDFLDCALHIDFEHGIPFESPLVAGNPAKICVRPGYKLSESDKPGFASIVIGKSHL